MKQYYHVTTNENWLQIKIDGLQPSIGKLSRALCETKSRIYLFRSETDMENALSNWLIDAIESEYGEDIEIVTLQITLSDDFPIFDDETLYESYSYTAISPDMIKLLSII